MSKTTITVIVFSSILLVCLIAIGIIFGIGQANRNNDERTGFFDFSNLVRNGIEVDETENLDLNGVDTLVVDCVSGNINIVVSDETKVHLKGEIWTAADLSDDLLKVTRDGNTLTAKFDIDTKPFRMFNSNIEMTVYLPAVPGISVKVQSASGDVKVDGFEFNDLTIDSTSGNTRILNCKGAALSLDKSSGDTNIESVDFATIYIDSTSGDIDINGTAADIAIVSTSGATDLTAVTGKVDIKSISGRVSVSVDGSEPEEIRIDAISGNVKLYLNPGANFELSAKATSGNINTDFEITVKGTSSSIHETLSGKAGNGGNLIDINTTSGNISLIEK